MAKIDNIRLAALNSGKIEARNLAECLAIDQSVLVKTVLPEMGMQKTAGIVAAVADRSRSDGISRQMAQISAAILEALRSEHQREAIMQQMAVHPSDTVRSWAVFVLGRAADQITLADRLAAVRPFAADAHFGVREWAWIAVRPYLAADIAHVIACLTSWTADKDANIRRFAIESIRPRGVWCEHIKELKDRPGQAEPLLDSVRADASRYVQDSVSNWINDASKSRPQWATQLCARWQNDADAHTQRIIGRALRTLANKKTSLQIKT